MNYKSLANKGRYGDTEIRNVAGRTSHVNPREANLIDILGRQGEALTQALGAGTRNPMTGMPEYHIEKGFLGVPKMNPHNANHALESTIDFVTDPIDTMLETVTDYAYENIATPYIEENYGDAFEEVGDAYLYSQTGSGGGGGGGYSGGSGGGKLISWSGGSGSPGSGQWDDMEYSGDLANIITDIVNKGEYDIRYDFNNDGVVDLTDIISASEVHGGTGELEMELTPFDPYTAGEFAPSKDEFQQFLETGNFEDMMIGFGGGWTEEDFSDVLDMDKLGFIQEGYDLQTGKLAEDKRITGGILQDQLTSAKGQYGRGLEAAGYNVGRSLFDVKQQVEGQQSKGGFAGSGFVAATGERAKRGLFQDYRAQQRELSAGLTDAKTAFKWGKDRMTTDYQYGMDMARLGLETDIHDFWSDKYSSFYDRLSWLED